MHYDDSKIKYCILGACLVLDITHLKYFSLYLHIFICICHFDKSNIILFAPLHFLSSCSFYLLYN